MSPQRQPVAAASPSLRVLGWLRGIALRLNAKRRRAAYDEIVTDADELITDRPCGDD